MKIKGLAKVITVLALVASVSMPVFAGAVTGARADQFRLSAGATHTFNMTFYGGELATVVVEGDGDTDLDVYVYDAVGNLITKDDDYSDYCVVKWRPYWTGVFRIKVVNRGNVYNDYSIETN